MHTVDITLDKISKIEGSAGLEVRVCDGKVEHVHFKVADFKRFFTEAMKGKNVMSLPQFLARICGTCSNAHLICSIEACERALGIQPSTQTLLMRHLTMYGLNIRDHALHLYLFVMPDLYGKDAFLDFDENDPEQHQLLHDAFDIKAAGNYLSTIIAGRSVHAINPTIGGYLNFPKEEEVAEAIKKLEAIRPAVLRLIKIFENSPFHLDRKTNFMALVPNDHFGFIEGKIVSNSGERIEEKNFADHLEHTVLPYSEASAYKYEGQPYMVGALARINLSKDLLNSRTKDSLGATFGKFPSTDIFNNNLAQAIEILHSVDHSIEILKNHHFINEEVARGPFREGNGVGVVEAPRGTLYHRVEVGADGTVRGGAVIVPTGQNQINMERDISELVQRLFAEKSKEEIAFEIEKLIRAYDPCISCAAHFLKIRWR